MNKTRKTKSEKYMDIKAIVLEEEKALKRDRETMDLENPLDVDLIKTRKAMTYEKILEIIRG